MIYCLASLMLSSTQELNILIIKSLDWIAEDLACLNVRSWEMLNFSLSINKAWFAIFNYYAPFEEVYKPCPINYQGTSNLVWWLAMTSRWSTPIEYLGFIGQRSRSLWGIHVSQTFLVYFNFVVCFRDRLLQEFL